MALPKRRVLKIEVYRLGVVIKKEAFRNAVITNNYAVIGNASFNIRFHSLETPKTEVLENAVA